MCPSARPAELSPLCAQCGGGERGAGLCAMGRGVLLRPLKYTREPWEALPIPLLSSEVKMWL